MSLLPPNELQSQTPPEYTQSPQSVSSLQPTPPAQSTQLVHPLPTQTTSEQIAHPVQLQSVSQASQPPLQSQLEQSPQNSLQSHQPLSAKPQFPTSLQSPQLPQTSVIQPTNTQPTTTSSTPSHAVPSSHLQPKPAANIQPISVCQVTAQIASDEATAVVDEELSGTMYGNETVGFMLEWKIFGRPFYGFVSLDTTTTPTQPGTDSLHEEANNMASLGRVVVTEGIKHKHKLSSQPPVATQTPTAPVPPATAPVHASPTTAGSTSSQTYTPVVSPVPARTNGYVPIVTPGQPHSAMKQAQVIDVDANQPSAQHIHLRNQLYQLQLQSAGQKHVPTSKSQVLQEMSVQPSQLAPPNTYITPQKILQQNLRTVQAQSHSQTPSSATYVHSLQSQSTRALPTQENPPPILSERQLQQMHHKLATPTSHVESQPGSQTQPSHLTEQQMHRASHPYPSTQPTQPMTEQQLQHRSHLLQQQQLQQQLQQHLHHQQLSKHHAQPKHQLLQNPLSAPSSPAVASPPRSPSQPSSPLTVVTAPTPAITPATPTSTTPATTHDIIPNEALVQLIVQHRMQTASLQRQHQERLSLLKELLSNQVITESVIQAELIKQDQELTTHNQKQERQKTDLKAKLQAVSATERAAVDLEYAARIQKGDWEK